MQFLKTTDVWFISNASRFNPTTTIFNDIFNENMWAEKRVSNALLGFTKWDSLSRNRKKHLRSQNEELRVKVMENYSAYTHVFFADDGSSKGDVKHSSETGTLLKTNFESYLLSPGNGSAGRTTLYER